MSDYTVTYYSTLSLGCKDYGANKNLLTYLRLLTIDCNV